MQILKLKWIINKSKYKSTESLALQKINDWLCVFSFSSSSRIFNSYMDVSIAGEGPQYWGLKINIIYFTEATLLLSSKGQSLFCWNIADTA